MKKSPIFHFLLFTFYFLAGTPPLLARAPQALLWIPSESFSDWSGLSQFLWRCPDIKLTVGLTPEMAVPSHKALEHWIASGRVEPALRFKGDPILPKLLDYAPDPHAFVDRLSLARELWRGAFGAAPSGIVPGEGMLNPRLLGIFKEAGFRWAAAGAYTGSSSTWAADGELAIVPFETAPDPPGSGSWGKAITRGMVVADETLWSPSDAGATLRWLTRQTGETCALPPFEMVSQGLSGHAPFADASAIQDWPTWAAGASASSPQTRRAWELYGEAVQALGRYQNSGGADVKNLEDALRELSAAEGSSLFRALLSPRASEASEAERSLKAHLSSVCRIIGEPTPESLSASLTVSQQGPALSSSDLLISQGPAFLEFDNPSCAKSHAPPGKPPLPDGTDPAALWRIESLRIDWNTTAVLLNYRLSRLEGAAKDASALGSLLLETYMDINHIRSAGSTRLLGGEPGIAPRDAWEYALSVSKNGAALWRSSAFGPPVLLVRPDLSVEPGTGTIRVSIPRSFLRGNPERWGYITAAFAAAAPGILGLIGSCLQQKRGLSSADSPPLLNALRASEPSRYSPP